MSYIIDSLIEELRSPKAETRENAARLLGQKRIEEAIPSLVQALSDQATEVCFAAMKALVQIGLPAIPALEEAFQSPDSSVRYASVAVLRAIDHEKTEPILVQALNDQDEAVQTEAAEALTELATPEALTALEMWHHSN